MKHRPTWWPWLACLILVILMGCQHISVNTQERLESYQNDITNNAEYILKHGETLNYGNEVYIWLTAEKDDVRYSLVIQGMMGIGIVKVSAMKEVTLQGNVCDQYIEGVRLNLNTGKYETFAEHQKIYRDEYVTKGHVTSPKIEKLRPKRVWREVLHYLLEVHQFKPKESDLGVSI